MYFWSLLIVRGFVLPPPPQTHTHTSLSVSVCVCVCVCVCVSVCVCVCVSVYTWAHISLRVCVSALAWVPYNVYQSGLKPPTLLMLTSSRQTTAWEPPAPWLSGTPPGTSPATSLCGLEPGKASRTSAATSPRACPSSKPTTTAFP